MYITRNGRHCQKGVDRSSFSSVVKGDDVLSEWNIRETMKQLMAASGISGHEDRIAALIQDALVPFTTDVTIDRVGNLIAKVEGHGPAPRPSVLLAAHMDEIGLMVTKIEAGGFMRMINVGGVDPRTQVAQEVTVHTRTGDLVGIIGSKPPHLTSAAERGKAFPLTDLFIDLGLPEAVVREQVQIGDPVTIRRQSFELAYDRISGKAMDNRASVAAVFECLAELKTLAAAVDVYAVFTIQEERNRVGAGPAGYNVNPDLAIAIDVTFAQMPGTEPDSTFPLGSGPAIFFGPNGHRTITAGLEETARQLDMPHTREIIIGDSGTDAWSLQIQRAGIPTGLISIPLRYMHTSVETVCYQDIVNSGRLLAHYIAGIDRAYVEGLSCYLKD